MKNIIFAAGFFVFMSMRETDVSAARRFSKWGDRLGALLKESGLTMAAAESCTGGTIASMMTAVAGSSAYFKGGVVSYAVEVKTRLLGVDISAGVVSESVARQMAEKVAAFLDVDCAVATTGVAGPGGGSAENPIGTVWIAAYYKGKTVARKHLFTGDREMVILQAADVTLSQMVSLIQEESQKND